MINLNLRASNEFIEKIQSFSDNRDDNNLVYKDCVSLFERYAKSRKGSRKINKGYCNQFVQKIRKVKLDDEICTLENLRTIDNCFSLILFDADERLEGGNSSYTKPLENMLPNLEGFLRTNFNVSIENNQTPIGIPEQYFDEDFEKLNKLLTKLILPLNAFSALFNNSFSVDEVFNEIDKVGSINDLLLVVVLTSLISESMENTSLDNPNVDIRVQNFFSRSLREYNQNPDLFNNLEKKTLLLCQNLINDFISNKIVLNIMYSVESSFLEDSIKKIGLIHQRTYAVAPETFKIFSKMISSLKQLNIPQLIPLINIQFNDDKYIQEINEVKTTLKKQYEEILKNINAQLWKYIKKGIVDYRASNHYDNILLPRLKEYMKITKTNFKDLELDSLLTLCLNQMGGCSDSDLYKEGDFEESYQDYLIKFIDQYSKDEESEIDLPVFNESSLSIISIAKEQGVLTDNSDELINHIKLNDVVLEEDICPLGLEDLTNSSYNIYQIRHLNLVSNQENPFHDRVLSWFDPLLDVNSLYPEQKLSNQQKNRALITHNFAWAANEVVLNYGVDGEYVNDLGEKQKQKTLPVKVVFDDFPQDSFYGKIVMTRGSDNMIYHRHITRMEQDSVTEQFIDDNNLEYDLGFPSIGDLDGLQDQYLEVLSNLKGNEAGDGSYIDRGQCKSNIIAIRDQKNRMTLRIPVKI